jgi:hypothetical protein
MASANGAIICSPRNSRSDSNQATVEVGGEITTRTAGGGGHIYFFFARNSKGSDTGENVSVLSHVIAKTTQQILMKFGIYRKKFSTN